MEKINIQRRKEKLKELLEEGNVTFIKHLFEIEEMIEEMKESIKPLNESQMESVNRIVESVVANIRLKEKGDKGDNYIFTDEDKEKIKEKVKSEISLNEIAKEASKFITVPIVEKIIEKIEVIKETPIITNEIKEVALKDTAEELRDKLEAIPEGDKLSIQAIQDLPKILEELRAMRKNIGIGGGGINTGALQIHFIDDETPTGTIDGVNTTFTTNLTPATGTLKVYRGGARQRVTQDYTLSGNTITFTTAPEVGEVLLVDYRT